MPCHFLSSLEVIPSFPTYLVVILEKIIFIFTLTHYKINQHLYSPPGQYKDLRIL